MNELKFRAWNKLDLKNGIYKSYHTVKSRDYVKFEWVDDPTKHPFTYDIGNILYNDDWIVEQYTGLKDKNGVEIYEGDVLFHLLQGRRKVYYPYSETVASYGLRDIDNGMGSTLQDSHAVWEVIGNIHENGDLLK